MPTVWREGGLRFFIWSNDHDPAHVHVEDGSRHVAKILIESGEAVENTASRLTTSGGRSGSRGNGV